MIQKIGSWAGMLGTALFTLSFMINGFLRPGYNPVQRYVSELSIGPQGWIQIVSFLFLGICIVFFALGLKEIFQRAKRLRRAGFFF